MQKGRYLLLSLIALGSIPSSLAQNAEITGDKNAHHIVVPITTKSLAGVVSGDPSKPGAQFVIRMYNDANFIVLPHWHPEDEHVTVVKGTWYLGSGDTFDRNAMRELNVGDYALVPKKMPHFAWSKNDTIILIHGIGPFQQINTDAQQSLSGWTIDPQNGPMRDPQSLPTSNSNSMIMCGRTGVKVSSPTASTQKRTRSRNTLCREVTGPDFLRPKRISGRCLHRQNPILVR
jgi:Cupin